MAGDDGFRADVGGFPELAHALADGARSLDEAGAGAPEPPDAGESTPAVTETLGSLSQTIGLIVTAIDTAEDGIGESARSYQQADDDAADSLLTGEPR